MAQDPESAPDSSPSLEDFLWEKRCDLLYKAWVQLRYHRKRQRFFDLLDKGTKACTLLLGASLFGAYLSPAVPWIGVGVSALGLLALVFGYGDRKQLHKELAERASAIIRAIEKVPAGQLSPSHNADWAADYADLMGKCPPPLKALTIICEHEQSSADGHPDHVRLPSWGARKIAHFC